MKNTLKRVLCLALAVVMVMGLGISALADSNKVSAFPYEKNVTLYYYTYESSSDANYYSVYDWIVPREDIQPTDFDFSKISWEINSTKNSSGTYKTEYVELVKKTETNDWQIKIKSMPTNATSFKFIITATYPTVNGNVSVDSTVTVQADAISTYDLSIKDTKRTNELNINVSNLKTLQLKAVGKWLSGTEAALPAFKSSDLDVATVDSNGKVTAKAVGEATITATWPGTNKSKTLDVTVSDVKTVTVAPKNEDDDSSLIVGETLDLDFEAKNKDDEDATYDTSLVEWTSSDDKVAKVDKNGVVTSLKKGTANITATVGGVSSEVYKVTVKSPTLTGASLSKDTLTLIPGDIKSITVSPEPSTLTDSDYAVKWEVIENDKVVTGKKGTIIEILDDDDPTVYVKGLAVGEAKLRATVTNPKDKAFATVYLYANIKVGAADADLVEADATVGTKVYMSTSIADDIAAEFKDIFDENLASDAKITFTDLSTTYGRLYTSRSYTTSSYYAAEDTEYDFSTFKSSFAFNPSAKGAWTADYSVTSNGMTLMGTIRIDVAATSLSVTVYTPGSKAYEFSEAGKYSSTSSSTSSSYSGYTKLNSAIVNAFSGLTSSSTYYVVFDTVSTTVGRLYKDSDQTSLTTTAYVSKSALGSLYYVPAKAGTFTTEFTVYDASKNALGTGTLKIYSAASSADITITLDDAAPYSFSEETDKNDDSAYDVIEEYIYDKADRHFAYIKFDEDSIDGEDVGTLYENDDKDDEVGGNTKYYSDDDDYEDEDYFLSDLYFVPEEEGTFEIKFTAYRSNGNTIGTYTLCIEVPDDATGGSFDLAINAVIKEDVELDEDMFIDWFQSQTSTSYDLGYIVFDSIDGDGTFYYDDEDEDFDEDTRNYDDLYFGTSSWDGKKKVDDDIDNLMFTAPSSAGYTAIKFTCYGGTDTDEDNKKESGTLYIFYTKGEVKDVTVSVKSTGTYVLDEDDFVSVHKTAMGITSSTSSSLKHYIELMGVPSRGTLYYNYTNSSKVGTKLTSNNCGNYELFVKSSDKDDDSVESLTYIPYAAGSGSYSVNYIAYSSSGKPLYVGTLSFDYGKSSSTISTTAEGYTFKLSDFYSSTDKDPIVTLYFSQPANGKLYVNYANGSGTAITSTTKLYTVYAANGSYPVSSLTYIPKAGYTGTVNLSYTATTSAGKVSTGTVAVAVTDKTKSDTFTDVDTTFSWAAGSIDFAQEWGLVNGTSKTTFSPKNTMTRAQLVTILYRAAGSPSVTGITNPFRDVSSSLYYYNAVLWASKNGIVTGTSSTTFGPDGNVTREQVATFLYRYAKYKSISVTNNGSLSSYTDNSKVSSYAKDPMTWAVSKGIITGTTTTTLSPADTANRAQVAVMLHRFLTY